MKIADAIVYAHAGLGGGTISFEFPDEMVSRHDGRMQNDWHSRDTVYCVNQIRHHKSKSDKGKRKARLNKRRGRDSTPPVFTSLHPITTLQIKLVMAMVCESLVTAGYSQLLPVMEYSNRDKSGTTCRTNAHLFKAPPSPPVPFLQLLRFHRGRAQRRGRRPRHEVDAERRRLQEEAEREIDAIVAEAHRQLPREQATEIGIAYARYSTEFQHSIADQIRGIFECAIKLGIFIPREHIFFDQAVRGCKERRPGLDPVRALLKKRAARVLLVFTTNRLFRKLYKCMKFVEEEVVERGLRCIFPKSGIDTNEGSRWRLPLQIHALTDELVGSAYVDNIRAAHEGLFIQKYVVYTLAYGYMGKEVEGPPTKRQRPRCEVAIDPETSEWVKKIFHWFVEDRLPLCRIIERLNDEKAPFSPMSNGVFWTYDAVRYLLKNPCYRGSWAYGKGENVWQSQKDYTKRSIRPSPRKEMQFEDLRLVSDKIWYRAQQLLSKHRQANAGRKSGDGNTQRRPRILNGLLFCLEHDRPLRVGGTYGQHMFCPACRTTPKAKRALFTYLNRSVALRRTCHALTECILADESLIGSVIDACRVEIEQREQVDYGDVERLHSSVQKLDRQIAFILEHAGDTDSDRQESAHRLKSFRAKRSDIAARVAHLEAERGVLQELPSENKVRQHIENLREILVAAGTRPESDEEAGCLREILELMTGGRINLEQVGERRAGGGWLRGRFRIDVLFTLVRRMGFGGIVTGQEPKEVLIDYREWTVAEKHIDEVIQLYQTGRLVTDIGEQLKIDRHQVTEAIRIWHERKGLPAPVDGRRRRASVPQKNVRASGAQKISDEVKRMFDEGQSLEQIALHHKVHPDTVRAALKYWCVKKGMPMVNTRKKKDRGEQSAPGAGTDQRPLAAG